MPASFRSCGGMTDLKLACGGGAGGEGPFQFDRMAGGAAISGMVQRTGTKVRNRSISQVRPARVRIGSRPAQIWPSGPGGYRSWNNNRSGDRRGSAGADTLAAGKDDVDRAFSAGSAPASCWAGMAARPFALLPAVWRGGRGAARGTRMTTRSWMMTCAYWAGHSGRSPQQGGRRQRHQGDGDSGFDGGTACRGILHRDDD